MSAPEPRIARVVEAARTTEHAPPGRPPVRVVETVRVTEYAQPQPARALPRGYDPETDSPLAGSRLTYQPLPSAEADRPKWWRGWRWIR